MPAMLSTLLSITVGKIQHLSTPSARHLDAKPLTWSTAIYKNPVPSARITAEAVEGDQQADLQNHGGPDNVVLAYAAAHYPFFRHELNLPDLAFGHMGENLTLDGDFSDDTVCVGDTWHVGPDSTGVRLQVTQPRQPCFKLARRLNSPLVVKLVKQRGWGGWYSRVLQPGVVNLADRATLLHRPHPDWPCTRAAQAMYARNIDPDTAAALAALPELSARWKQELIDAF